MGQTHFQINCHLWRPSRKASSSSGSIKNPICYGKLNSLSYPQQPPYELEPDSDTSVPTTTTFR